MMQVVKRRYKRIIFQYLILSIGIFILFLNIYGEYQSLRNNHIYCEKLPGMKDIEYSEKQFRDSVSVLFKSDYQDKEKVRKAVHFVNRAMAHYWRDEGISTYNLRVPVYENYILFFINYLYPKSFPKAYMIRKYEFCDYDRAIERGVGLCSQHATVLSQLLNKRNIRCQVLRLDGHVVAYAEVDSVKNKWWVLDADYGVIIPYSIKKIEKETSLIRFHYEYKGYPNTIVTKLMDIFGKNGNILFEDAYSYFGWRVFFERFCYFLKWAIPIFFLLISFLLIVKG